MKGAALKKLGGVLRMLLVAAVVAPLLAIAQDWYEATGKPIQRSALSSADLRDEFALIETNIANKLPVLAGNGSKIVAVNSGGTALEALSSGITVAQGGTGATTLTGLLQGNGTSAVTGISNSSTVGQTLRVTGASTYAWGALDLADGDAITGDLPDASLSSNVPLLNAGLNTFTGAQLVSAALPQYLWDSTGASANNRKWNALVSGSTWELRAYNDALDFSDSAISIQRTAGSPPTITSLALEATAITLNGAAAVDSGGGNDEFSVGTGTVAMIGAITGGASGGIDMTPQSGTFTASFDAACTTTPTLTFDYQRIGNIMVLAIVGESGFPCTSDATNFQTTGTPVPAGLGPSSDAQTELIPGFQDNSANAVGCLRVASDRNIVIALSTTDTACGSAWTGSGNKRGPTTGHTITYMLGNP